MFLHSFQRRRVTMVAPDSHKVAKVQLNANEEWMLYLSKRDAVLPECIAWLLT